jgi:hypothetical protein
MQTQQVAQPGAMWTVEGKLLGKSKAHPDYHHSADVSGIAGAPATAAGRICLLADDETQGAQIVVLAKEGQLVAGDFIRLSYNRHDDEPLELDAEGVAYAGGFFYVTGSHGRPRHRDERDHKADARAKATRFVFRIGFDLDAVDARGRLSGAVQISGSTRLTEFFAIDARLREAADRPLEENGITIEGMDIRDERIYFGLRSPVFDRKAAILSLPVETLFEKAPGTATLHWVDLNGRGVRDLAVFDGGFLILAGPSQDPPSGKVKGGDYKIFSWDGGSGHVAKLSHTDLTFGSMVKPEALLPLQKSGNRLRALMFFDGPEEGGPRSIEIEMP